MVAYTKRQHRKKEESEQLRGLRDKIKFIVAVRIVAGWRDLET